MDYTSIIAAFPVLADYPRASVEHWIALAPLAVTEDRFGANRDQAMKLFIAHATVFAGAPIVADNKVAHRVKRAIPAHSAPNAAPTAQLRAKRKAMMVWGSTSHGVSLAGLARY